MKRLYADKELRAGFELTWGWNRQVLARKERKELERLDNQKRTGERMATATPTTTPNTTTATSSRFRKGSRKQLKLRMALDGPSGAGKTYTALRMAFALATNRRVAVIGTEGSANDDSAEKYYGTEDPDHPGQRWEFDVLHLDSHSPSEYRAAIEELGRAGYEVGIIDSLSHAWEGKDGALELKDKKGGNSFTAWKDITPLHRAMVESILTSPCHMIATMRSKTDYVVETDTNGKSAPRKIGMAPVQRQGMEYEFDIYGSLDWSHMMTVTKSRCPDVDGEIVVKPGKPFMQKVISWLNTGVATEPAKPSARITDAQLQAIADAAAELGWKMDRITKELPKKAGVAEMSELNIDQADGIITWLAGQIKLEKQRREKRAAATNQQPATNGTAAVTNGTVAQNPATETTAEADQATTDKPSTTFATPEPGAITDDQLKAISFYLGKLVDGGMPMADYKGKILKKRNVQSAKELTSEQAKELIASMRGAYERQQKEAAENSDVPF